MSVNLDLVERLEKNSTSSYIDGMTIFLKLINNIIENPKEEKFRKFKKTNPRIANELLSLDGMESLILDAGFEADKEEFVLRRGGLGIVSKLKTYRDFYQKRLDIVRAKPPTHKGAIQQPVVKVKLPAVKITANKPFHDRISYHQVLQSTNEFIRQIEQISDSVMQYEDLLLQQSALQLIPIEKLKQKAIENLRKLQKFIKSKALIEKMDDEPPLDDLILEELAAWFKNDFFTWINAPKCKNDKCKNEGLDAVGIRTENGVRIEVR